MYINLSAIVLSLYIPEIFRHRILFNKVILTFYSSFTRNKKVKRIVKKFPDLDGFYILLGNTLNFRRAATIYFLLLFVNLWFWVEKWNKLYFYLHLDVKEMLKINMEMLELDKPFRFFMKSIFKSITKFYFI